MAWEIAESSMFRQRLRRYEKRHQAAAAQALVNAQTYFEAVRNGLHPMHVNAGFIHPELGGAVAVDERGSGKKLHGTRLYLFAEIEPRPFGSSRSVTSTPRLEPIFPRSGGSWRRARKNERKAMPERYGSVSEMLADHPEGQSLKRRYDRESSRRTLARALFNLRNGCGLTQQQVAEKMGMAQSAVSRIEHCANEKMRVEDIQRYVSALGYRVSVGIHPENITDSVKFHAFEMRRLLLQLTEMCKGDSTMESAAAGFLGEAIFNLVKFVDTAASQINATVPMAGEILEVFTATPEAEGFRRQESATSSVEDAPEASETSRRAASAASRVLRDSKSSKSEKSAAGSALSQRKTTKVTSNRAASAASKTLRSSASSKTAKTSSSSALTQRPNRKK